MLNLCIFAIPLELVHSLLEKCLLILVVFLILLFLFLQEIEFTSPESLVFFELSLDIGVHSFNFVVLDLPLLYFFPDAKFSL